METFTCVIIDDEFHAREGLKKLLSIACPDKFDQIILAKSIDEGVVAIKEYYPDIVFLDINLQKNIGFELFDYFEYKSFEVVFTTGYNEYVLEAVNKYGCLGYLLKPVDISELKNVVERYQEKVNKLGRYINSSNNVEKTTEITEEKIFFSNSNVLTPIAINDIVVCKADDNYCEIYTTDNKILITKPLKEVEGILKAKSNLFYRIHRSYLLNINYIKEYNKKENLIHLKTSNESLVKSVPITPKGYNLLKDFVF